MQNKDDFNLLNVHEKKISFLISTIVLLNGAGNLFVWVFKFSISAENNIIPLNSNVVFYAVSLKMY